MWSARFQVIDDSEEGSFIGIKNCSAGGGFNFGSFLHQDYSATCSTMTMPGDLITVQLIDDGGAKSQEYTIKNPCTPNMKLELGQEIDI